MYKPESIYYDAVCISVCEPCLYWITVKDVLKSALFIHAVIGVTSYKTVGHVPLLDFLQVPTVDYPVPSVPYDSMKLQSPFIA